jgi:hypothetical protein
LPPATPCPHSSLHVFPPRSAAAEQAEAKQKRAITDIGDGMLEGAGALGSSFLRGVRGLVEKPLAGARAAGVEGAVKGIGRGIIGAVANPVSGVLDALRWARLCVCVGGGGAWVCGGGWGGCEGSASGRVPEAGRSCRQQDHSGSSCSAL